VTADIVVIITIVTSQDVTEVKWIMSETKKFIDTFVVCHSQAHTVNNYEAEPG